MNDFPPNEPWWLDAIYFSKYARAGVPPYHPVANRTMEVHDQYEKDGHFSKWRKRFSARADDMAEAIVDYTKSSTLGYKVDRMEKETLAERLYDHLSVPKKANVFDPWVGWFYGAWTKKTGGSDWHYHIWDNPASKIDGRELQFVTQTYSFGSFVYSIDEPYSDIVPTNESGNMLKALAGTPRPKVDLGLDVYSGLTGITGWVSKYQDGKEWPHMGYLYNPELLLWFAHEDISNTSTKWWCFLERGNKSRCASIYDVTGFQITVPEKDPVKVTDDYGGYIRFYNQIPYIAKPSYEYVNWEPRK